MFEARSTQDGDPLADVFPDLPPEEGPGDDPEWDEFVATVLAGDDTLTATEVQEALAAGLVDEDYLDDVAYEDETSPSTDSSPTDPPLADPPLADVLLADLDDEALLTDLKTSHRAIATAQARRAAVIT